MAYDGILINSIVNELRTNFINGRVDKIHQPEKDRLHISIWCKSKTQKLLLCVNPNHPRIHITQIAMPNPATPPMFCMLLRKHLLAGRIIDIAQPDFERIVELHIETMNEMGDLVVKKLIIECMGKHSNIILVDDGGKILDSIKHITHEISRVREILPGKQYISPPTQDKSNPLNQDTETLEALFAEMHAGKKLDKVIAACFTGISRITAQEIALRAANSIEQSPAQTFMAFFEIIKDNDYAPTLLVAEENRPIDILPFPYVQFPPANQIKFESPSELVEYFYSERDRLQRLEQNVAYLNRVIQTNLERCYRKLALQLDELQQAEGSDKYRLFGELITANLHLPLVGLEQIEVINYYHPDAVTININMDKNKTPAQNAQEYFKKYSKSKNALKMLSEHISQTRTEIDYLEAQSDNLEKCTEENEFDEIRNELVAESYIKEASRNKKKSITPSAPHRFVSSDGFEIFVGKNNLQNDTLTLKTAASEDIWMHTKNIPGSHVIIRTKGSSAPHSTILEGAMLAAYFSKAKKSGNVPVDYCPRKNVKKPRGSKPGMVTYEKYRTLYITPSEEVVKGIMGFRGKAHN